MIFALIVGLGSGGSQEQAPLPVESSLYDPGGEEPLYGADQSAHGLGVEQAAPALQNAAD